MPRRLRVGIVQLRCGPDPAANMVAALPLLREAAADGARLIATPENTTRLDGDKARLLGAVRPEAEAPEIAAWGRLAAELGVHLLLGSGAVAAGAGRIFNRSILFAPDGAIAARYDKINLFDVQIGGAEAYAESETVAPGERAVVAPGPADARIGLSICYDLRFPELYRALARAGAELIAVPSAFTVPTGQAHWETLLRARAIETGAFVLAPAQGGIHEGGRRTWGRSMIVDPWGRIVAALGHDEPAVAVADLDLDLVAEARAKIPAWRGPRPFAAPEAPAE